jgi:hypothetical protein
MNNVLPYVTKGACEFLSILFTDSLLLTFSVIWSLTGFAVICITVLSCASPNYNSGKYVDFADETLKSIG